MKRKRVVYLGAKAIGLECLRIVSELKDSLHFELAGVLTNSRGEDIRHLCRKNHFPLLESLDDFLNTPNVDLAVSVQYHEILKTQHIKHAGLIVNLHMAPLPEYRGCNQFSFAIIDGASTFGTTIHLLEEGIDSGPIIAERRFSIPPDIWVSKLYELTFKESVELFRETFPILLEAQPEAVAQETLLAARGSQLHFRREIEELKCLDLSWDKARLEKHIRATYMPGFAPPYFVCAGKTFNIVTEK